jgi:hypothetical protein
MSETAPQNDSPSGSGAPLQTVSNGRQARGRFAPGNKAAQGNGQARKVARFRASMFAAVKAGDVRAIVVKLLEQAKAGEGWAVKLALEYLVGPPRDVDLDERLTALEETVWKGKQ